MSQNLQNKPLKKGKTLFLFDIDGTLCEPKMEVGEAMTQLLKSLSKKENIGIACVSCADMKNAKRELKDSFSYFSKYYTENGLVTYDNNLNIIHHKKMKDFLGQEKYDNLIKFFLDYIDKVEVPFKVGNYLDERSAVINVSPVGNPITKEQREEYRKWEQEHHTSEKMRKACEDKFGEEYKLRFTKGGIKSFDVFPIGWDKTYCLQFIEGYDNIIFFGDNTYPGGSDYDLAINERITRGIGVKGPEDTINKVNEIINELENLK
jgi:phosphomannomutase